MTGEQTFVARAVLGVTAGAATVVAVGWRRGYEIAADTFYRSYFAVFAGVRLLLFAVVFLVLKLPVRGDLPSFYMQEAWWRLAGRVPYRDFPSSYAPLSAYLYGAVYSVHPSPLTLVLFAVLVEIAAAVFWVRVLRAVVPEGTARMAALLCLCNPISLQFVTVDGQNNVLISFFLALSFWLLLRKRAVLSGASVGLAIASVKFLPLLFMPAFVLSLRRKGVAWAGGCVATVVAVYGYFAWVLRAPVLDVLTREGDLKTAGGLPYLVESISGVDFGMKVWDRLLLAVLVGLVGRLAWLARRRVPVGFAGAVRATMPALGVFLLVMMALAKKTWPTYSVMVLFPLAMVVAGAVREGRGWLARMAVWLFVLFSVLSVTVHSFWASVLVQAPFYLLHAELVGRVWQAWVLLGLEMLLFAMYGWLIWLCMQEEPKALRRNGARDVSG